MSTDETRLNEPGRLPPNWQEIVKEGIDALAWAENILDRELLGIAEALRSSGLAAGIVDAALSRGLAGISGSTLVVNIAGSRAAVRDGMATLSPLASQIIGQLSSLEI